jgi:hypothetical protein
MTTGHGGPPSVAAGGYRKAHAHAGLKYNHYDMHYDVTGGGAKG